MRLRPALFLSSLLVASAAWAQLTPIPWRPKVGPPAPAKPAPTQAPALEPTKMGLTFDKAETPEPGVYLASGNVRFTHPDLILTCDAATYDTNKGTLWATGQVTVDFEGMSLSGSELRYDLNSGTGEVRDAYGTEKTGLYVVQGRVIRKTGPDWFEVEDGVFTSCNAAEPPWSIRIATARFHIDHYAFLTHPRFKIRSAPVFYLPYLVWPIKPERASGLLFPQVGSSDRRGFTTSNALFLAPSDWWDTTLYVDTFQYEGVGVGQEFRYALTPWTFGWLHGYYIDQRSDNQKRWDLSWGHQGRSSNGWQFLADVNLVSDANFWRDYQRDYTKGTMPGPVSRLFLSHHKGPYSLNLRAERRQEYGAFYQQTEQFVLPGIEWRSAPQHLGKGLYLGWETSFDGLRKEWFEASGATFVQRDLNYGRFDLYPSLEWPLRTVPWLDITPRLALRATGYSESYDPATGEFDGGTTWREYGEFSLRVAGPRLYRRYAGGTKHVFEPFAEWRYSTEDSDEARIPVFDALDEFSTGTDLLRYGLRNRFYNKAGRLVVDTEVSQSYSGQHPLTTVAGDSSAYSPVLLSVRAWFSNTFNADARIRFNTLTHAADGYSLSVNGATKDRRLWARLGYVQTERTAAILPGSYAQPAMREASVATLLKLWGDKVTVNAQMDYNLEAKEWRNLHTTVWYQGSCYAIGLEAGRREIGPFRDTEVRILVRLKQVGNVVDLATGSTRYSY